MGCVGAAESVSDIIAMGLARQARKLPKPRRISQVSEKAKVTTSRTNDVIIVLVSTVQPLCGGIGCLGSTC